MRYIRYGDYTPSHGFYFYIKDGVRVDGVYFGRIYLGDTIYGEQDIIKAFLTTCFYTKKYGIVVEAGVS